MDNYKEVWKDIQGYEGYYQVSNIGRVRSCDREAVFKNGRHRFYKGQFIRPTKTNSGYWQIRMKVNGHTKHEYAHRLVAKAFVPNPDKLPEVNHKDENRLNNRADNLEWVDHVTNLNYGNRAKKFAISRGKEVGQFTKDGKLLRTYYSTREAGRHGYNQVSVSRCATGKAKTHKGYTWKYI